MPRFNADPNINNETPISHYSNHMLFVADRADLGNGVVVIQDKDDIRKEHSKSTLEAGIVFGAWHAMNIWPCLNGFQGYNAFSLRVIHGDVFDYSERLQNDREATIKELFGVK